MFCLKPQWIYTGPGVCQAAWHAGCCCHAACAIGHSTGHQVAQFVHNSHSEGDRPRAPDTQRPQLAWPSAVTTVAIMTAISASTSGP